MGASNESEALAQELSNMAGKLGAVEARLKDVEAVIDRLEAPRKRQLALWRRSRRTGTTYTGRCVARSSSAYVLGAALGSYTSPPSL